MGTVSPVRIRFLCLRLTCRWANQTARYVQFEALAKFTNKSRAGGIFGGI